MNNKRLSGLSLVIFGYNEAGTLFQTSEKSLQALNELCPNNGELIIIDDGSTDETPAITARLSSLHPQIIIRKFEVNKGIGEALKEGYKLATKEFVCAIPADGQFDLNELLTIPFPSPNEIICFTRHLNKVYTIGRILLTSFNRLFNRFILGFRMHDVNWIKIYHTRTLARLQLVCSSSIVETEICAKMSLLGLKFIEVKSSYLPRASGESKGVTTATISRAVSELWRLFYEVHCFRWNGQYVKISAELSELQQPILTKRVY